MGDDLRTSLPTFTVRSESRPSTANTMNGTGRTVTPAGSSRAGANQSSGDKETVSSAGAGSERHLSHRQSLAVCPVR